MEIDIKDNNPDKPLTPKEERFCYEYVLHLNGSKAAINAGYSAKTARSMGSQLLTKINIKNRIKYLKDNLAETAGISALRVIKEHEKLAFNDAGQIRDGWMKLKEFNELTDDQRACIQEVSTRSVKKVYNEFEEGEFKEAPYEEEWVKIKLYDKQKSLDSLSRMLGYDAPIKQETTITVSSPLTADKRKEIDETLKDDI